MEFGQFIRLHRERAEISQKDFAAVLQVSAAYWSRIEREMEKPPKDELILAAAEHLGLPSDDAFIAAGRLPPDMRPELGRLVRMYREHQALGQTLGHQAEIA